MNRNVSRIYIYIYAYNKKNLLSGGNATKAEKEAKEAGKNGARSRNYVTIVRGGRIWMA